MRSKRIPYSGCPVLCSPPAKAVACGNIASRPTEGIEFVPRMHTLTHCNRSAMDGCRTFVHGTLQRRLIEYIRLMQLQLQGTDSSEGPGNSIVLFIMHQTAIACASGWS